MTLIANMAYKKKDVLDGEVLEEFWLFASCVVLTDVSRKGAKSQRGSIPRISTLCAFASDLFDKSGFQQEWRRTRILSERLFAFGLFCPFDWKRRKGPNAGVIIPLASRPAISAFTKSTSRETEQIGLELTLLGLSPPLTGGYSPAPFEWTRFASRSIALPSDVRRFCFRLSSNLTP